MSRDKPTRYTVMIVPDAAGKDRSFSLKRATVLRLGAGLLVLLLALAGATYYYLPRALSYDNLADRHQRLMEERFQVLQVLDEYSRIKSMDNYIRQLLGGSLGAEKVPGEDYSGVDLDSVQRSRVQRNIPATPSYAYSLLDNVPSLPPVEGYVTQDFYANAVFDDGNHYGLDIIARQGEVVRAAAAGLVIFSNWTYQYGNTVIVDHGNGYITVYGHNQRNVVGERQRVERGDPIAFLGNTGISRGPHLHFEIWKDGEPRNPKDYIFIYEDNDVSVGHNTQAQD